MVQQTHSFAQNENEWGIRTTYGAPALHLDSRTFPMNSDSLCLHSSQTVNVYVIFSVYWDAKSAV